MQKVRKPWDFQGASDLWVARVRQINHIQRIGSLKGHQVAAITDEPNAIKIFVGFTQLIRSLVIGQLA